MKCKNILLLQIVILAAISTASAQLEFWELKAHKVTQIDKLTDGQTKSLLRSIIHEDIRKNSVYLEAGYVDDSAENEFPWYGIVVSIYNNALNHNKPESAAFLKTKGAKNVIKSEPLEKGMKCCSPENESDPEKCKATAPSGTIKVYYESDPPEVLRWWGDWPMECLH